MIHNYFSNYSSPVSDKDHSRMVATAAALEIIKAAVSAPANSKNVPYELGEAIKLLPQLTDAIQNTIGK